MNSYILSFFMTVKLRVQQFLLTNYCGLLIDPISLSYAFEKIEKYQRENNNDHHVACIGCEVTLTDRTGLTIPGITLSTPCMAGLGPKRLSYLSPLGSAILNTKEGQQSLVYLLRKSFIFTVLSVRNNITTKGGD